MFEHLVVGIIVSLAFFCLVYSLFKQFKGDKKCKCSNKSSSSCISGMKNSKE